MTLELMQVGDYLPALILPPITRTTLALFAGASNDHNPMHIDIDFARNGGMPDVFAHGMLGMAYLGRLLTQWVDQRQLRAFNARFVAIVELADEMACTGKVVENFEAGGERRIRLLIQSANQRGVLKITGDAVIALLGPDK